jgi:hypothetical protein
MRGWPLDRVSPDRSREETWGGFRRHLTPKSFAAKDFFLIGHATFACETFAAKDFGGPLDIKRDMSRDSLSR